VLGLWRATWADTRDFVDSIVQRARTQETSP